MATEQKESSLHTFNDDLLSFLARSPTPFHAVTNMAERLEKAGFSRLSEDQPWHLEDGGRYFVERNGSSLVAFNYVNNIVEQGYRMVGAHTDSPCLKVKPEATLVRKGYLQLGVEVYGGALLAPWFDRDLSLAGRVSFLNEQGRIQSVLINFSQPIAVIPSLAIHLDREANNNRSINPQQELPPVLCRFESKEGKSGSDALRDLLKLRVQEEHGETGLSKVLDYDLFFYDTQKPELVGLHRDFIASARLDNLLSCFIGLNALLDGAETRPGLVVFNDHEEVGSMSAEGAQGPFLKSVLERISGGGERQTRMLSRSFMISADNAHGVHPNYLSKHDENHGPLINHGPVIKVNANQRYATNSETSAFFRYLAEKAGEPCQTFVVRTDMACGSTIGPITASGLGVRTLDIGVPQFAMHSIRELAGSRDAWGLYRILKLFFGESHLP